MFSLLPSETFVGKVAGDEKKDIMLNPPNIPDLAGVGFFWAEGAFSV